MSRQSRFNAWNWMLGAGALGWPRGMVRGGRREEGSGWGTRVYLWRIHVDIWQNQYNIVKLKNKIKIGKKNKDSYCCQRRRQWHPTPVLLPGKSHGWRSLEGCSPWGRWGSDTTEHLHFHFSLSCIGEGNGNPLQCSCLENPRDRKPVGLPSVGSHRVGHDWSDLAVALLPNNWMLGGNRKELHGK